MNPAHAAQGALFGEASYRLLIDQAAAGLSGRILCASDSDAHHCVWLKEPDRKLVSLNFLDLAQRKAADLAVLRPVMLEIVEPAGEACGLPIEMKLSNWWPPFSSRLA